MERTIEERKTLDEGLHTGVIIAVEERTTPQQYKYIDLVIEVEGMKLKTGYPDFLMTDSKLGVLLKKFGASLIPGEKIDPSKILIGQKCTFLVAKKGIYSNILPETVKPSLTTEQENNLTAADYEHN